MMLQDKYKNAVLLFAAFIILVLSFQFNFFGAATKSFFEGHQRDSESLVLGRIIETKNNGFLSNGGFLGRYASDDRVGFQYEAYVNDLVPESTFGSYRSSFGLQGYFYAVLDSGFSIFGVDSGSKRLFLSKLVTSSLLALLLVLFIYFVNQNFGIFTAFLTTALLATSQWLVVFSNNLYWMFFLIILPFIVVNSFLQFKSQGIFPSLEKRFYILYLLVFLAVFIKSLAGYEYISTILISTVVPLVFFAINDGWKLKTFFTRFVLVGLSGLAGFFTAIFVHLLQLANTLGSFSKGLEHLWYTVAKRTYGDPNTVHEVFRRSLESNVFDVILKYWNGRAFNLDSLLGYGGFLNFSSIIIFIIILTIIITSLSFLIKSMHTDRNKNLAMIAALWFSISAPLSWHLLAKGHSFIHGHMNHVLWYIPFLLIGFAYIGYVLCLLFKNFKFFSLRNIIAIIFLVPILVFIIYLVDVFKKNKEAGNYFENIIKISNLPNNDNISIFYAENSIVFLANVCDKDLSTRFFLHIVPTDEKYLSENRKKYNFDNLDFNWDVRQSHIKRPYFLGGSTCAATVPLGSYPVKAIRTGQFNREGRLWESYIDLTKSSFANEFTAFNLSDNNWDKGISRTRTGLFIASNFENRQSIMVGDKIEFSGSGLREVESIQYSAKYMNIYVSGSLLNPITDGYPNKFVVVKSEGGK